jgi:hypothetical protein
MAFTIVSFFTEGTPYEREVRNLKASLEQHHAPYFICGVRSLGSWEKNCQYKADFILGAMSKFHTDIVWIDADAVITKYPSLFDSLECDIAYHYLPKRRELLSGTLFIKNNERMKNVVKEWIALNGTNNKWDQKNLQEVVEKNGALHRHILPASYCKIFDNRTQEAEEPVIIHYQASRRYRKAVGKIL